MKAISGLSLSAGVIDKTSFRTTGYREFCGSIADGGTLTLVINFNYTLETHSTLLSDLDDQAVHTYTLEFPDEAASELELPSIVVGFEINAELDQAVIATITLKVSGNTAWGEGFGSGWNPSIEPELVLWLEADREVTESGGVVTRWEDPYVSSRYLDNPTAGERPTVDPASLNGRNTLLFNGDGLFINGVTFPTTSTPNSAFVLAKRFSTGAFEMTNSAATALLQAAHPYSGVQSPGFGTFYNSNGNTDDVDQWKLYSFHCTNTGGVDTLQGYSSLLSDPSPSLEFSFNQLWDLSALDRMGYYGTSLPYAFFSVAAVLVFSSYVAPTGDPRTYLLNRWAP